MRIPVTALLLVAPFAPHPTFAQAGPPTAIGDSARPVTVSGLPPDKVWAGNPYLFRPMVAVREPGTVVRFEGINLPEWASLDPDSGVIHGTPLVHQVGTAGGIFLVAYADGVSSKFGPFSITTRDPAIGNRVTLSWLPPLSNEDESTLTDLAGYRIFVGRPGQPFTEWTRISNPSLSTVVLERLGSGIHLFRIVTVARSGSQSVPSRTVWKRLD